MRIVPLIATWQSIEHWFTSTIPGIILLGAAGSLVAVGAGRYLGDPLLRLLRTPVGLHRRRKGYIAYMLGFCHFHLGRQERVDDLVIFLVFHVSKVIVLLFISMVGWVTFIVLIAASGLLLLTISSYLALVAAIVSAYYAIFEFEFVYRTFLAVWRDRIVAAQNGYSEWRSAGFPAPGRGSEFEAWEEGNRKAQETNQGS